MRVVPRVVVILPWHLVRLTGTDDRTVVLELTETGGGVPTLNDVVEGLARRHPVLGTALREPVPASGPAGSPGWRLRPYLRAFGGTVDLTAAGLHAPLPARCLDGSESVRFVGAIAGGGPTPTFTRPSRPGGFRPRT